MENITKATPAEIDAVWADLSNRAMTAFMYAQNYREAAQRYIDQGMKSYAKQYTMKADDYSAEAHALDDQIKPLRAEWKRRGGWTRAFLVCNSNGHVHKDKNCSSCFADTRYAWMTEFSGLDEAEIVDAAGERACTVCYPSAPVEVLNKPTRMFTPGEKRAQEKRDEQAAKRAAKEAKKVIHPTNPKVVYGTERAALNAILAAMDNTLWYGSTHPSAGEWASTTILAAEALAWKTGRDTFEILQECSLKATKKNNARCKKCYEQLQAEVHRTQLQIRDGVDVPEWRKAQGDPQNWVHGVRKWAQDNGKI